MMYLPTVEHQDDDLKRQLRNAELDRLERIQNEREEWLSGLRAETLASDEYRRFERANNPHSRFWY